MKPSSYTSASVLSAKLVLLSFRYFGSVSSLGNMQLLRVTGKCSPSLDIDPQLFYYTCDRPIIVYDYHFHFFAFVLQAHSTRINCLKALPNNQVLSGGCDCKLILWSSSDSSFVSDLEGHCNSKGNRVISLTNATG